MVRADHAAQVAYQAEYIRKHYQENKDYYKTKARENEAKQRLWWKDLKSKLSCTRCSESHPGCLDFHHRDPKRKEFNISAAIRRGLGRPRILAEIEKCDVLCSNCHRKLHYDQDESL